MTVQIQEVRCRDSRFVEHKDCTEVNRPLLSTGGLERITQKSRRTKVSYIVNRKLEV